MSSQLFLQIKFEGHTDPIKGGVVVDKYEDQIELLSFSWGMSVEEVAEQVEGESGSKRADYDRVDISKVWDKSSVPLSKCMALRTKMEWAEIAVEHHTIQHGGERNWDPVMLLRFEDGFLSKFNVDLQQSDKAASVSEKLSLNYKRVIFTYWPARSERSVYDKGSYTFMGEEPGDEADPGEEGGM